MSSIIKFQLPPIKGTDVFPETIKTPPIVHASVDFLVDNENPVAPEVFEDRARSVLAEHAGAIGQFVQSQRQNYGNGIVDYTKTSRSYPAFDVSYMNIQGRQEIVTLNMRVDVRRHGVVEEEERDELCVAVFHDGNQVSYAPMSELDNPTGNASRRILNQSNWGTKIIKTSQMKFVDAASSIYTELNGLVSGTMIRGDYYAFTTSALITERLTESITHREWPIMAGNSFTTYIPSATISLNDQGDIINYAAVQPIEYTGDGTSIWAWHITAAGDRYSGGISSGYFDALSLSNVNIFIVNDYDSTIYPADGANFLTDPPVYNDAGFVPDRYHIAICKNGVWEQGDGTYYNPPGGGVVISELNLSGFPAPMFAQDGGIDQLNTMYSDISARFTFSTLGVFTYTHHVTVFNFSAISVSTTEPGSPLPVHDLKHIPFPPSIDNTWWYEDAYFVVEYPTTVLPTVLRLQTSYGAMEKPTDTSGSLGGYRGWLHISNGEHLIQAFWWGGDYYVYLDRAQITSLLGVPVESIQTVLFDIPRSKIEQFQ